MKSVRADIKAQKAKEVLLREKEGNLRTGRRYRPGYPVPSARMDVLRVQRQDQSETENAKFSSSDG